MTIGSYQAFYNLIKDSQLAVAKPLGDCIHSVASICSCRQQAKNQKSDECNQLYINFINTNGEALKDYFAIKTTDSEILFNHNSHHQILKVKLR